jgi:hypothetical protein
MNSLVEVDKQKDTMFLKVGNDWHKKKPDEGLLPCQDAGLHTPELTNSNKLFISSRC